MTHADVHSRSVRRRTWLRAGFTMVELLVVIVIIGMLTGLSVVGVSKILKSSDKVERDACIKVLKSAITAYKAEENAFPFSGSANSDSISFGTVSSNRPQEGNAEVFMELCGRDASGKRDTSKRAYLTDTSMFDICKGGRRVQKLDEALANGGISSSDTIGFVVRMEHTKASSFKALSGARAFAPVTITFDMVLDDVTITIPSETQFARVIKLN